MNAQATQPQQKHIARYHLDGSPVIARVDVEKGQNGSYQLALYAAEHASSEVLSQVPDRLTAIKAYGAYHDVRDGHNVLIVPQVKDHEAFIQSLPGLGLTNTGGVHFEQTAEEHSGNVIDFLKKHTLDMSGWAGTVGYGALGVDGLVRGDNALALSGIAGLSPVILAIYGNGDKSGEMDRMLEDMRKYFADAGVELPEEDFTKEKQHFFSGVDRFLKEHPVEISYTLANVGAFALLMSGIKELREEGKFTKVLISTSTLLGNCIVALVPEKHVDESKLSEKEKEARAERNLLQKAVDFVQESPLRIHGILNTGDIFSWAYEMWSDSTKSGRAHKVAGLEKNVDKLLPKLQEVQQGLAGLSGDAHSQRADLLKEMSSIHERLGNYHHELDYLNNTEKDLFGVMSKADASGWLKGVTAVGLSLQIILGGISHKNKSHEEQVAAFDKVFAVSAKMLSQLPETERGVILDQMTTFLTVNKTLQGIMSPDQVKEEITSRVEIMLDNPWLRKESASHQPEIANNAVPFKRKESVEIAAPGDTPDNSIIEAKRHSLEKLMIQTPSLAIH